MWLTALNSDRLYQEKLEPPTPQADIKARPKLDDGLPPSLRVYNFSSTKNRLMWLSLTNGGQGFASPTRELHSSCHWVELQDSRLFFTGGDYHLTRALNEVWTLDVRRDFATIDKPNMLTPRYLHQSVCCDDLVYVLCGTSIFGATAKCERFSSSYNAWESIPAAPSSISGSTAILIQETRSIYLLGGSQHLTSIDVVSELSVDSLRWRVLPIQLTSPRSPILCFSLPTRRSSLYFVNGPSVYCLDVSSCKVQLCCAVRLYKCRQAACYYIHGTLYYSRIDGEVGCVTIGAI
jgi:hypothetical protein